MDCPGWDGEGVDWFGVHYCQEIAERICMSENKLKIDAVSN